MTNWSLSPHPYIRAARGPVVLAVLDGMGIGLPDEGNAIWRAQTPTLDHLHQHALQTVLKAHGKSVGLPTEQDMGNSEVGHNALGAGRVFNQGATLVDEAIRTGQLFKSASWKHVVSNGTVHFIGLLSDGNVHSHHEHLHAMLRATKQAGVERARVHVLLDGRDVPKSSALQYIGALEKVLTELGGDYAIGSGGGRMVTTMDRYEADWSIVARGWDAHVHAKGRRFPSARVAIETMRTEEPGIIDQYLPAFVIEPCTPIEDGDGVVFFNFRGDRAIEISRAFEEGDDFQYFDRGRRPKVRYAGMMQYDGDLRLPSQYLVSPPTIDQTMGEYLAYNKVTQWACSETQKYGHVTYFWNGNRSGYIDKNTETYLEIPSDNIPFDQAPAMKASEITQAAIQAIQGGARFLRMNYANGDMVGHTGHLEATIRAVEAVDQNLAQLMKATQKANGVLIVTADHGNADEMLLRDKAGAFVPDETEGWQACTSHSCNPVPLYIMGAPKGIQLSNGGGLANVASTALACLGFAAPEGYEESLFQKT